MNRKQLLLCNEYGKLMLEAGLSCDSNVLQKAIDKYGEIVLTLEV